MSIRAPPEALWVENDTQRESEKVGTSTFHDEGKQLRTPGGAVQVPRTCPARGAPLEGKFSFLLKKRLVEDTRRVGKEKQPECLMSMVEQMCSGVPSCIPEPSSFLYKRQGE